MTSQTLTVDRTATVLDPPVRRLLDAVVMLVALGSVTRIVRE